MACPQIPWQIMIIVLSIILILCSSLFWYYLYLSTEGPEWAGIVIYTISGVTLVLFGLIGIIIGWRKSERGLLFFGGAMGVMFAFQMVQIMIATVTLANCGGGSILQDTLCDVNQYLYYAHTFIVLVVALLLCIISLILRKIVKAAVEDEDNYY
eukprot:CAMPEP_0114618606 /NCGR_PEP_ID=MMETSP0168-20121206/7786_1 /TAXON_ID=95228 ORGANISM="Vannella sp., Strain DIVA3 517/6/12" /NCGR_SAMPLE_ID=MMETSP0168 /ASSEMBLY_ACC=CAM_ASM_000044 /LENGTH=153 /DNA_ID=CAMNT_0001829751 /DNA_START=26 /DNA_END=487 /DNA_ORIENTATION=+